MVCGGKHSASAKGVRLEMHSSTTTPDALFTGPLGATVRTLPLGSSSQSACGALEPVFNKASGVHAPKETNSGHLGPRRQKRVRQLEEWRNVQVKH